MIDGSLARAALIMADVLIGGACTGAQTSAVVDAQSTEQISIPASKPSSIQSKQKTTKIQWPDGAGAALSLSYDDALESHLDTALPGLDKHGFKASFYLTIERPGFHSRIEDWRTAAQGGHELGNHSLFHPCSGPRAAPDRDWVTPEIDLDNYTIARLVSELQLANNVLNMVDGETIRTYGYPCGDHTVGGESYIEAIKTLFIAGRGVTGMGSKPGADTIDPYTVTTYAPVDAKGSELIAYVEQIQAAGGFGTITFHGIGGDYLSVSAKAHNQLLDYLASHQDEIWVDNFRNIMSYVNEQQSISD